jgi:hypothetical protein
MVEHTVADCPVTGRRISLDGVVHMPPPCRFKCPFCKRMHEWRADTKKVIDLDCPPLTENSN